MSPKASSKPKTSPVLSDNEIDAKLASGEAWTIPINNVGMVSNTTNRSTKDILDEVVKQLAPDTGAEWFESGGFYILAKPIIKIKV